MAFAIGLIIVSSFIVEAFGKEYEEDTEKIDDIFFSLLLGGFIGGRIFYALVNFNLYRGNILSLFKISHYNLSLIGSVITGLLVLVISSKKYKIELEKLLKIFAIPFYFSMAVGIWVVVFDKILLPLNISNNPVKILYLSIIFLVGMILEILASYKSKSKYITPIILLVVMGLYYLI